MGRMIAAVSAAAFLMLASAPAQAMVIPIGTLEWFQSPDPCDPLVDPFCPSNIFTVVNVSADPLVAADLGLPVGGSLLFQGVVFLVDGSSLPAVPFDIGDLVTSGQTLFDGVLSELTAQLAIVPILGSAPTGQILLGTLSIPTLTGPGDGLITFTTAAPAIPEPAALLLVATGIGVAMRRKRF